MGLSIFVHNSTPDEVVLFLQSQGYSFEDSSTGWKAIAATPNGEITFTYDQSWCSPPNWPRQLQGLGEFVAKFPAEPERHEQVQQLVRNFTFVIGVLMEDTVSNDLRYTEIAKVATISRGSIFSPSALLTPDFEPFISVDGDASADVPPVKVEVMQSAEEFQQFASTRSFQSQGEPPAAQHVVQRMYCLALVAARAMIDVNHQQDNTPGFSQAQLQEFGGALNIRDAFENQEIQVLNTAEKQLDEREILASIWRVEGASVLAWALSLTEKPIYDKVTDFDTLMSEIGLLNLKKAQSIIERATLQAAYELTQDRVRAFSYNWRMVDFRASKRKLDFVEDYPFSKHELDWVTLNSGDLQIAGLPISEAAQSDVSTSSSIAIERHIAHNWLHGDHKIYSEVETST